MGEKKIELINRTLRQTDSVLLPTALSPHRAGVCRNISLLGNITKRGLLLKFTVISMVYINMDVVLFTF